MQLPTDTIEHDGESYVISYDELLECGECGQSWDATVPGEADEANRTAPRGETTCPACGATSGHAYVKRSHYYLKYSAIPIDDPPLEVAPHGAALRRLASEFEALAANGWELVQSDGVHLDFEKVELESTDSDHRVTDVLE